MKNTKFIITTLIGFLAAWAVFSFIVYYFAVLRLQENLLSQKKQEILEVLDKIGAGVSDSSFLEPDSLISLFSESLEGRFKIRRIALLDDKARILACTQAGAAEGVAQSPDAAQLLKTGQSGFYFVESEKPLDLHLLRAFTFHDRIAGGVETVFDIGDVRGLVRGSAIPLLLLLLGLFLLLCVLFLLRTLKTLSAFNEMKRALLLLESGHFGFEIRGEWRGGLKEVFFRFSHAVENLKEREIKREALFERAKHIAAAPRQNDLFDMLTESLKTECGAEQILIMLVKDETLIVNHVAGYDESLVLKNEIYRTQEDVFTEIMDYGKPLVLDDAQEIRQNARYKALLKVSGLTALFPVTLGNEIFGIIHLSRSREKGPYKAVEMDAGVVLSGGAAIGLMHLSEGVEARPRAVEIIKPELREYKDVGRIEVRAVSLTGGHWVEFFELAGEKKEDTQIMCIHGADPALRLQIRERAAGMLDVIRKFRSMLGNLSFFALSMLLKMPVSTEREQYVKQFMENPFTPEGLSALFKGLLIAKDLRIGIEVIKVDAKKKSYLSMLQGLKLFLIPDGIQASAADPKGRFKPGDCLVAAPENLLSVIDFETLKNEKAQEKMLTLLQSKYESLKMRAEENAPPCPAVIVARYVS